MGLEILVYLSDSQRCFEFSLGKVLFAKVLWYYRQIDLSSFFIPKLTI